MHCNTIIDSVPDSAAKLLQRLAETLQFDTAFRTFTQVLQFRTFGPAGGAFCELMF
jgi:hypothetical protein